MLNDPNCMYCAQGEELKAIEIYIADLEVSKLYLFKEQTYYGRCVIAYKEHVNNIYDLSEADAAAFTRDICKVAKALDKAFKPAKVNIGMYNDKGTHLHAHIVPKYVGGHMYGSTFEMKPTPGNYLSDAEYSEVIAKIKASL